MFEHRVTHYYNEFDDCPERPVYEDCLYWRTIAVTEKDWSIQAHKDYKRPPEYINITRDEIHKCKCKEFVPRREKVKFMDELCLSSRI